MIVMKFGGTSVGSAEAIKRVTDIIKSREAQRPVVVVSAVGGITNKLVELDKAALDKNYAKVDSLIEEIKDRHENIVNELGISKDETVTGAISAAVSDLKRLSRNIGETGDPDKLFSDSLFSQGEFMSANILTGYLKSLDMTSVWVDSRDVLLTDSAFTKARPQFDESMFRAKKKIVPHAEYAVVVMQGFIGSDKDGNTTTLGRGGSDYSATLFGAMIDADAVEIWTDVDGVLTADPSLVKDAKRIKQMTPREAAELAYFGAKVLHPATLIPAVERDIPVYVLNSMRPVDDGGTRIAKEEGIDSEPKCIIKSIAYKENLTTITVTSTRMLMAHGFLAWFFEIFKKYNTAVDLVATSEVSVSVTIDSSDHLEDILKELSEFSQVEYRQDQAIVCVVGEHLKQTPGMSAKIFGQLDDVQTHLISYGASDINLNFVIDNKDIEQVVKRLHGYFFSGTLDEMVFA